MIMEIAKKVNYFISKPVTAYSEIKADVQELKQFIDAGKFKGNWQEAYAISHCQVSDQPYCFFVIANKQVKAGLFRYRVYLNLKIIEAPLHIKATPIPGQPTITAPNAADFDEACMSFPYRQTKRVLRYNKIKISYQIPILGGLVLRTLTEDVEGIPSQVYQHEYEHSLGNNIYFNSETPRKWWDDEQ